MTGHQASRLATRIYLHFNLTREQRALIRVPAPGTQFERYRPCSPSLSAADYAEQQATPAPADQHLYHRARHNPVLGITREGCKNRITPLDAQTAAVLRAFTTLPTGTEILFPTRTGTRMSPDAVAKRLTQHAATASMTCSISPARSSHRTS